MAHKWYQKATVQGAIVGSAGLIIIALIPIVLKVPKLKKDNESLQRQVQEKTFEIQRLETMLAPFRTVALERYTVPEAEALQKLAEQIDQLQVSDVVKSQRIKELESQLKQTAEKVKPPTLTLLSQNVVSDANQLVCTLRFMCSKNVPLGTIQFIAELPSDSRAIIKNFWPSTKGGAFQFGSDSKFISEDSKAARLIYKLMSAGHPVVELTLSGPSTVKISGNFLPKAEFVEVRKN